MKLFSNKESLDCIYYGGARRRAVSNYSNISDGGSVEVGAIGLQSPPRFLMFWVLDYNIHKLVIPIGSIGIVTMVSGRTG